MSYLSMLALSVTAMAVLTGCLDNRGKGRGTRKQEQVSVQVAPGQIAVPAVQYSSDNISQSVFAAYKTLLNRAPNYESETAPAMLGKSEYEVVIRKILDDPSSHALFQDAMINEHRTYLRIGGDKAGETLDYNEPAKLGAYIITNNRDYREIVTAKYCAEWSSGDLRQAPCDAFGDANQSKLEQWGAGVLSTRAFINAHKNATGFNFRLVREAFNKFACSNYPDVKDPGMPAESLASEPIAWAATSAPKNGKVENCYVCHRSMNAKAVPFYNFNIQGFFVDNVEGATRRDTNLPSLPSDLVKPGVQMTVMGMPVSNMADLGSVFAKDPRFAECMTKRYYNFLLGQPYVDELPENMRYLIARFERSNYRVKELIFNILTSAAFVNRGQQ